MFLRTGSAGHHSPNKKKRCDLEGSKPGRERKASDNKGKVLPYDKFF